MFHPAARHVVWVAAAIALQRMDSPALLASSAVSVALSLIVARADVLVLLKRIRWVLASIVVLFLWGTPGIYVWPDLGAASPTREGILAALEHGGRLVALVSLLGLALGRTPASELLGGVHWLMAPLARIGFPRDRIALRLMLVLDYVRSDGARPWKHWMAHDTQASAESSVLVLRRNPLRPSDFAVLAACAALGIFVLVK